MKLDILYQDADLVAVRKPAGVMVHRSALERRGRFVLQMLRDQFGLRVHPVHRLDRQTAGVLVFGRHREATRRLAVQFSGRTVGKTYLAVVRGFMEAEGEIDYPLTRNPAEVRPGEARRPARTRFRTLGTVELPIPVGPYTTSRYSLLEVRPVTGRMHQIRRHLRHVAHPIVGDKRYGDNRHNRSFKERFGCERLLLAAVELNFRHPCSDAEITVSARLERGFWRIVCDLGWHDKLPVPWKAPDRAFDGYCQPASPCTRPGR
jgi:tRNA pseudouridine65 synthase